MSGGPLNIQPRSDHPRHALCSQPWVNVYVTLPGVGNVSDNVSCDFGTNSFDLKVTGLNGKNYRLLKPQLDKDVVVDQCKFRVKTDRVTLKLRKVKGEYSYDNWSDLAPKKIKSAEEKQQEKDNPSAGIMGKCCDAHNFPHFQTRLSPVILPSFVKLWHRYDEGHVQ